MFDSVITFVIVVVFVAAGILVVVLTVLSLRYLLLLSRVVQIDLNFYHKNDEWSNVMMLYRIN